MGANEILNAAIQQGVFLFLEKGQLKYKVEGGKLSPEFKLELKSHKVEIIEYLGEIASQKKHLVLPAIETYSREQKIPLSYSQQRLWFVEQLGEDSLQYNMPGRFLLQGKLNVSVIKQVLKSLLDRHEVLRTHFESIDGEARQIIVQDYTLPFTLQDLSALKEEQKSLRVKELMNEEARKPFNLSKDLMLRMCLLKLTDESHLVLYTMHHIASDGWSLGIFKSEFSQLYEAFIKRQDTPLKQLKIQYADYALWQRSWLTGEVLEEHLTYWREHLAGVPAVHCLPIDQPRPRQQTFLGKRVHQKLDQLMTKNINKQCIIHETTLFMFLQTAFALLLGRVGNSTDIIMGTPLAGRTHTDTEALIGFFISNLVLRTDLSPNQTFSELLKTNKNVILDAYAHQYIPFEMLVDELSPERNLRYNPIIQISFVVQNNEKVPLELQEQDLNPIAEGKGLITDDRINIKYELALYVDESSDELSLTWVYDDAIFNDGTIMRLMRNYEVLLESIIKQLTNEQAEKTIDKLVILSQLEKQQQLTDWNQTQTDFQKNKCVHELFEMQVLKRPEAIAIVFDGRVLSYGELNRRSNQLAHYLISRGLKPNTLAGICIERSIEMVIGILAILKTGAAYVPFDPALPNSRLEYMLKDTKIKYLLIESEFVDIFDLDHSINKIELDNGECQKMIRTFEVNNILLKAPSSSNLAYINYTSGSTGRPKGVMTEHKGVVNYLGYLTDVHSINSNDKVLQLASLSFDASIRDLIGPLVNGAQTIILNPQVAKDPKLLLSMISFHQVTALMSVVPSLLRALVNSEHRELSYQSLRSILLSGEVLPVSLCQKAKAVFGQQLSMINQYGPTECTMTSTYYSVSDLDSVHSKVLIGRPIQNMRAYVLDQHLEALPVGATGELYLSGVGLARGYLNQPSLTAEKFIKSPFEEDFNARLYRTGDLVRYLQDGNLQFLGRTDDQIKLRGYRVELGEIESVLLLHEKVKEVVVLASDGAPDDIRINAYVVANIDDDEDKSEKLTSNHLVNDLRTGIQKQLPSYMVPSVISLLKVMPLTANGKIDRKALLLTDASGLQGDNYVAPNTDTEHKLVSIWSEVLQISVNSIGINDSFFNIGGHSLLAIVLVGQINSELDTTIELPNIFEMQEISKLASHIDKIKLGEYDNQRTIARLGQSVEVAEEQDIEEFDL